jgi:ligand-binding sensor domain-containing protein
LQGAVWRSYLIETGVSPFNVKNKGFCFADGKLYFLSSLGRLYVYNGQRIYELRWFRKFKKNFKFTSLCVKGKNFFFGTEKAGLLWIDRNKRLIHYTKRNSDLLSNKIKKVFFDPTERLIVLHSNGISIGILEPQKINWSSFTLKSSQINDLIVDKEGNFWLATPYGIKVYANGKEYSFSEENGLPAKNIIKISLDEKNNMLWVWGKDFLRGNYLSYWDGKLWHKKELPREMQINSMFSSKKILWLATDRGIYKYYKEKWSRFGKEDGVAGEKVTALLQGNNKSMYFRSYSQDKSFIGELNRYFLE